MPPIDGKPEGTESSTDAVTDAVNALQDAIDGPSDADAPSSGAAEDGDKANGEDLSREALMKVVRKAVGDDPDADAEKTEKEGGDDEADSPSAEGQKDQAESKSKASEAEAVSDEDEGDDEDDTKVPFAKHPRFRKLIRQRNELRDEVEKLRGGAGEWDKISTFMQENNLPQETVGRMYLSAAKVGGEAMTEICNYMDAVTDGRIDDALKMARQQVAELELLSGHTLSPDLKRRVEDGVIDQDSALQLSQAESKLALERRMNERREQERETRIQTERAENIQHAVKEWESRIRAKDPDYGLKQRFVHDRIAQALKSGMPSSQKEAVDLVQKTYDEINEEPIFKNSGRREEKNAVTGGEAPRAPRPEPKTMLEAVQRAME